MILYFFSSYMEVGAQQNDNYDFNNLVNNAEDENFLNNENSAENKEDFGNNLSEGDAVGISENDQSNHSNSVLDNYFADETEDDDEVEEQPDGFFYDIRDLPHPLNTSTVAVKRLNISFKRPPEAQLNVCVNEYRAAANQSLNTSTLLQSADLMISAVRRNVPFYHWCFYHYVSSIDWKLEEASARMPLQEKMTMYITNMKALWLLSRSLDRAVESKIYHDFTRSRYLSMSRTHFGRSLEVISGPLGDRSWIAPTQSYRPAEAFVEP